MLKGNKNFLQFKGKIFFNSKVNLLSLSRRVDEGNGFIFLEMNDVFNTIASLFLNATASYKTIVSITSHRFAQFLKTTSITSRHNYCRLIANSSPRVKPFVYSNKHCFAHLLLMNIPWLVACNWMSNTLTNGLTIKWCSTVNPADTWNDSSV